MGNARIGIRYCGGCNSHYERVERVQRVQSRVGDRYLFVCHDERDLDGLIVVNGCLRACGAKDLNQGDALNAVYMTTYDTDQKYKTDYFERFEKYLTYV